MLSEGGSWAWYAANTLWRKVHLPICGDDGHLNPVLRGELHEQHIAGAELVAAAVADVAAVKRRRLDELVPRASPKAWRDEAYWTAEDVLPALKQRWSDRLPGLLPIEQARVRVLTKRLLLKDAEKHGGRASPTRVLRELLSLGVSRSDRAVPRVLALLRKAGNRV